jgi:hypothetical protein
VVEEQARVLDGAGADLLGVEVRGLGDRLLAGPYMVEVSSDQGSASLRLPTLRSIVAWAFFSRSLTNRCVSSKCWNEVRAPSRALGAEASAFISPGTSRCMIRSTPMS